MINTRACIHMYYRLCASACEYICFVVNKYMMHGTKWLMRSGAINDSSMTLKRDWWSNNFAIMGSKRRYTTSHCIRILIFSSNEAYKSYKCLLPPSHHGRNLQLLVARQWNHDYWFISLTTDIRIVKLTGYVQQITFPINYYPIYLFLSFD